MGKEVNKWLLLSLKKKNELLHLYVRSGYTNLNEIKLHYNLFEDGGDKTNLAVPIQQRDAVLSYTPREQVKARQLTPEEQYNIYRLENTIQPMTPELKYKMELLDLMEKAFSERYAQKRIEAAKKGIAATTAVTSYVPGPIGAASRGVNLLLDVADFVDSPRDIYNTANAGTGVARAIGTSNITRHIPKVGKVVDNTLDFIGHIDEADDISLGEVSKKFKQTINNKAYGGYVGNYGDTNPGMTGMMKARMALSSEFGNSTARRMVNADGRDYTFTQEDSQHGGAPAGSKGNVYVSSYDNLITPQIQDVDGNLKFIKEPWLKENAARSYHQSIKFDRPEDAKYFGEHYKEIAPMMNRFNNGGIINSTTLKLNNLNTLYNIFDEGGNSAPKMLLRPVPQNFNILLFKRDNTPIFPINPLITTPSNTKQVDTPKVASRNIPAFFTR